MVLMLRLVGRHHTLSSPSPSFGPSLPETQLLVWLGLLNILWPCPSPHGIGLGLEPLQKYAYPFHINLTRLGEVNPKHTLLILLIDKLTLTVTFKQRPYKPVTGSLHPSLIDLWMVHSYYIKPESMVAWPILCQAVRGAFHPNVRKFRTFPAGSPGVLFGTGKYYRFGAPPEHTSNLSLGIWHAHTRHVYGGMWMWSRNLLLWVGLSECCISAVLPSDPF